MRLCNTHKSLLRHKNKELVGDATNMAQHVMAPNESISLDEISWVSGESVLDQHNKNDIRI